jgi:two-component system OmpR family response regulator
MRVLVVDDEVKLAKLLQRGLRQRGIATDVAGSGEEALVRARSTLYDAIVLDVMLPGADGFDVCRQLRDEAIWTPTLMLTALGDVDSRVRGLDTGADDYLVKPFSLVRTGGDEG